MIGIGGQGWLGALLAIWVGEASRGLFFPPRLSDTLGLQEELVKWLAPVGRMAFTNYISQSIILSLLFYGFGLGLMGRVGVVIGIVISLMIFTLQAVSSRLWLDRFQFGPLEWLWRSGMYGQRQTWRRV